LRRDDQGSGPNAWTARRTTRRIMQTILNLSQFLKKALSSRARWRRSGLGRHAPISA
jgi:hypothetical protein